VETLIYCIREWRGCYRKRRGKRVLYRGEWGGLYCNYRRVERALNMRVDGDVLLYGSVDTVRITLVN